jgi:hypothetical protein
MPLNPGRLAVTGGMLLAAASLGGCEYADGESRPAGSGGALSAPASSTMSSGEAARQAGLIAEVELLMGEPDGVILLGTMGGMQAGQGLNTSGQVSAELESTGSAGRVGGAVRFAGPLPSGETGAAG